MVGDSNLLSSGNKVYHGLNRSSLEGHLPKLYTLSFCNSTKGMVESRISSKRWLLCLLSISLFLFVLYVILSLYYFHSIYLLRFFTGILHSNFKPHAVRLKTHTPKLSFLFLFPFFSLFCFVFFFVYWYFHLTISIFSKVIKMLTVLLP